MVSIMNLLLLATTTCSGIHYHSFQSVDAKSFSSSLSPCHPEKSWSRSPPTACIPPKTSTIPSAFLTWSLAKKSISSRRPSTIIPALSNQFGHDRLSLWSSSTNCNSFHTIGQHSTTTTTATTGKLGTENRLRDYRNSCTRIYAKQELEEDVTVDYLDKTIANNLATLSKNNDNSNNNSGDKSINSDTKITGEITNKFPSKISMDERDASTATSPTTINNNDNTATDNNNPTAIPPEFLPILALCFLVTLLSALDRVAMSIAILPLSAEFHYSETIKGQISSAVSYGYAIAILPIGLMVSVVSSRVLMMVGVFLWSCATLATPWMAGLSHGSGSGGEMVLLPLLLIRAVMGAAEAVVLPTMQRILAQWVPPEKKATVLSIVISGFQLGTVGAYLVSPLILDYMSGVDGGPAGVPGWRGIFYVYGSLGLLWMVPWWLIAKDAPEGKELGVGEDCEETFVNNMLEDDASLVWNECPLESNNIDDETPPTTKLQEIQALLQSAPWSDFLTSPGVWAMTLAHAAKNWELYNLLAWTPTFFSEQYGLNVKESALFSVLPSVCGMVGGLTAGNAADYILLKFVGDGDNDGDGNEAIEKRTQVRKLFQSIALLGPAICLYLLSNLPEQAATAQVLLGGAVGLQAFDAAGFGAATQEKAGVKWAGLLYSLTSLPGVMVGSVSVSVTGQLLDKYADVEGSGWAVVYQLNAAICVVGALAFLLLYDSKKEFE